MRPNLTPTLVQHADSLQKPMLRKIDGEMYKACHGYGEDQPPATCTHSARQLPCLPSTSTISVSHLHRQPTPFSFGVSQFSQYSSSSFRFFSSSVVISRNGGLGS